MNSPHEMVMSRTYWDELCVGEPAADVRTALEDLLRNEAGEKIILAAGGRYDGLRGMYSVERMEDGNLLPDHIPDNALLRVTRDFRTATPSAKSAFAHGSSATKANLLLGAEVLQMQFDVDAEVIAGHHLDTGPNPAFPSNDYDFEYSRECGFFAFSFCGGMLAGVSPEHIDSNRGSSAGVIVMPRLRVGHMYQGANGVQSKVVDAELLRPI